MAGVEVVSGTPLQKALQDVAHQKVVEIGWTGLDDTSLAEYVVLMLMNGKTQDDLASELATDLLGLKPDDPAVTEFVPWLFSQVQILNAEFNGGAAAGAIGSQDASSGGGALGDSEMMETSDGAQGTMYVLKLKAKMATNRIKMVNARLTKIRPTGPKAMRNNNSGGAGGGVNRQRDRRMLGQMQKNMDRQGDSVLHRVRGNQGVGRGNSHPGREPPKGPRATNIARGLAMQQQQMPLNAPPGVPPGMNGMPPGMMPGMYGGVDPMQMQQMLSMFADAASVMQHYAENMHGGGPVINPNFQRNQGKFQSREKRQNQNGNFNNKRQQQSQDTAMGSVSVNGSTDSTSPLDMELTPAANADPATTRCHFDLACTRGDCPFVHQSPAAPPKTSIDMNDTCNFGAACRNSKCVGKHPSPAKKREFQNDQLCAFYPNCTKGDRCPFRHPSKGPCRNGADCQTAGCEWWHNTMECRYDPCTRPDCPFKHRDGQKRGKFENKTWVANGDKKEHVSERKFTTDEDGPEELILPGGQSVAENEMNMETQIITEG